MHVSRAAKLTITTLLSHPLFSYSHIPGGRQGHGSMPGNADNALLRAGALAKTLSAFQPWSVISEEWAEFVWASAAPLPIKPVRSINIVYFMYILFWVNSASERVF